MTETDMKTGVELIAEERQRHLDFTSDENFVLVPEMAVDKNMVGDEIALYPICAAFYCLTPLQRKATEIPWGYKSELPFTGDRITELVKAGALIAAEIDRLIRVEHNL